MIDVHRFAIASLLGIAPLLALAPAGHADPGADETQFLYELNRARNDPPGWAEEYGLDLVLGGDGELVTLIGVAPAPPLAQSEVLADSAGSKAEEMAAEDYFAHQSEVGPDFYWPNELVRNVFGYPLPATAASQSLADDANDVEAIAGGFGTSGSSTDLTIPQKAVASLIVDLGVPSLAHREQLLAVSALAALFTEAGVGYGLDGDATLQSYWALHTGLTDPAGQFATGVVFDDLDADEVLDVGEGLAGVTVTDGYVATTTSENGGYALPLADGNHRLRCFGGAYVGVAVVDITFAGANRAVDCLSGEPGVYVDFAFAPEPSVALTGIAAVVALAAFSARRRAFVRIS